MVLRDRAAKIVRRAKAVPVKDVRSRRATASVAPKPAAVAKAIVVPMVNDRALKANAVRNVPTANAPAPASEL